MRSEQSSRGCWSRLLGAGVWLFTTSACAPPARPLVGAITRDALPTSALSPRPQVLRFTWSYADETFEAAGDGAVRVMAPDRARLDFFLRNGMTTVVRLDGDTLRADLGQLRGGDATSAAGRVWRLQFTGRQLVAVERIEGGRVQESVHRHLDAAGRWQVQYLHPRGKRRLTIVVNDTVFVEGFDAAIWRR